MTPARPMIPLNSLITTGRAGRDGAVTAPRCGGGGGGGAGLPRRSPAPRARPVASAAGLLAQLERLDDVLVLDVVVRPQSDAALEALADLGDVVLEPPQRVDEEIVVDHDARPQQPRLRVPPDLARPDDAAGDVAELAAPEDLADLSRPELDLLVLRLEHAAQGGLDVLDRLVDDRVVPDVHALAVGQLPHPAGRPDVEADDDRVVDRRQVDVVLRDRTDTAVDDLQLDLLADVELSQGVFEGLDRTGHVALEDQVEGMHLALLQGLGEVLQADPLAALRQRGRTLHGLALLGDLPGRAVVRRHDERVAGTRHRREPQDEHRARREGDVERLAVLVEHRPDPAVGRARDDRVAHREGARLHEDRRQRAAALVEAGLDGDTARVLVGVGPQVERRVGGQQDRLEQAVDAHQLLGGDVDEHRVAAVLLGHEVVLGELLADLGGVGPLLVHLVDRDDDRDACRLGVVERLDGLRHDAVVGGHDEDGDVGHLRAAGTHGGERLVARGVDEGDRAVDALVLVVDLVGTDVLGDAARLVGDDVRRPDRVEQLGLAVVDVTHHRDDRRPRLEELLVALGLALDVDVEGPEQLAVLVLQGDDLYVVTELLAEQAERVLVERLCGRGHLAQVEQHGHQARRVGVDLLGEVGQRGSATQPDDRRPVPAGDLDAAGHGRLHVVELLTPLLLRLATADRTAAAAPEGALRAAATAAALAETTTRRSAAGSAAGTAGTTAAATEATATTTATGTGTAARGRAGTTRTGTAAGRGAADGRPARHHAGVRARRHRAGPGPGPCRARTAGAVARRRRTRRRSTSPCARCRTGGTRGTGTARSGHALAGRERVVARARGAGAGHALAGRERVVARARGAGARTALATLSLVAGLALVAAGGGRLRAHRRRRARARPCGPRRRDVLRRGLGALRNGRHGSGTRGGCLRCLRTGRTGPAGHRPGGCRGSRG